MDLCKIKIALLSAYSAAAGFALSPFHDRAHLIPLITGVFCLACSACALNQYQERDIDAIMERTRHRPLPSGRINPLHALLFSTVLMVSGFFLLLFASGLIPSVLGMCAIVWYNGLYTRLKKKSAFAVIPGAMTGVVPPAIGWTAGGGMLSDPQLLLLCFFFFIWQVPHFWLLIVNHGDEYKEAGLPSLTEVFTRTQLGRIIFIWIISTSVSCLFLSASGIIHASLINYSLFGVSLSLALYGSETFRKGDPHYSLVFNVINLYMFVVLALLSIDRFLI